MELNEQGIGIKTITKKEADGEHPANHFLVVEDPETVTTWHLRVKGTDGKPDHTLMGASWAALHGGYRGNKYEGPKKAEAISKLTALYKSEGMDIPTKKSIDLQQQIWEIQDSFRENYPYEPIGRPVEIQQLSPEEDPNYYVQTVLDDAVIVSHKGKIYKAGYKEKDGEIIFDKKSDWIEVQSGWVPVKGSETVVQFGSEVKALGDGKVGGYLVRFSDEATPDLTGDYFDSTTDFGEIKSSPVLYHHGLDKKIGKRVFGKGELKTDDVGIWIEAQLFLRDAYEKAIYKLAQLGKLGWSSGTANHLVTREEKGKAFHILSWPLGLDASLTPCPAEPRNDVVPLKSIEIKDIELEPDPEAKTEDAVSVVEAGKVEETITSTVTEGVTTMADVEKQENKPLDILERIKAEQESSIKAKTEQDKQEAELSAKIKEIVDGQMKFAPPIKMGGDRGTNLNLKTKRGDDAKKAFNYFLRSGDAGGIRTGEAFEQAVKTDYNFEEGTQYYGQEVVPTEIVAEIAKIREPLSFARAGGCRIIPVGTTTVWLPMEGGVVVPPPTATEKGEFTEDTGQPLTKRIVTIAKKAQSIFATTEVLEDTVVDLTQYLSYRWAKGMAQAENATALAELANSACRTLGVTAAGHDAIANTEVVKLFYTLAAEYRDNVSFLMNGTTEGYIRGLTGNWFNFIPTSAGGGQYSAGQPTGWLVDPRSKVFNYSGMTTIGDGAAVTIYCSNYAASLVLCERRGMTILRDPYTGARLGEVWFTVSQRFGFGGVNPLANMYLIHPTS